jgi:hypothetical protein
VLLATLMAVGAAVAMDSGAVQPSTQSGRVVSDTNPASWTPNVQDGYVAAFAEAGNTVLVGGNFTTVRRANTSANLTRNYLFAFDRTTGAISTTFVPTLNGEVRSIIYAGDGTAWIAGGFNNVNGQGARNLARVNITTGQRVTTFAPPVFNGRINDMQLRNGKLFVEGRFTTVGGQTHELIAAVDATTGALDPAVKVDFADPRSGGVLNVYASDVTPDGSKMAVVGNFTTINGASRYQIAQLDLTTSPTSVADWQTNAYGNGCSGSFETYMRDVEYSPDGSFFVPVTTGAYNNTFLCDVAARWETAATGTNLQPTWTNYSGGDTLTAVAITDSAVYVGGHQRWMNNRYAADRVGAGAVPREGLAALDPRSGATLTWNPTRNRGWGVYTFLATDSGLWIGSDTSQIAGTTRGKMAFLPLAGGVTMPAENVGSLPATVVSLGLMQGGSTADLDRTQARTFTGTSTSGSSTAAGTEDWSSLRGAFMVDGKLYTGWADRSFRVQDTNGTTFGPQTTIPLALVPGDSASLSRFATEDLANITGMFYDRATATLYFTRTGQNRLYRRSFSVQSNIVGAERFESSTGAGGVTWSGVQSMFLADGNLYTSDTSGNLVRRAWSASAGLPTGGATTVSGPGIDGQDWRARDAFVVTGATPPPPPPNQPPTASFSSSCVEAACTFDAGASGDTDGTIVGYSWNWGDATAAGSGEQAGHTYGGGGTYTVTLTVTDDDGATGSASAQVSVSTGPPPTGSVTFRGAAGTNVNGTSATVVVPTAVQAGDVMVLLTTSASNNVSLGGPAGWTLVNSATSATAGMQTALWTRTATAADAGAQVRVTSSAIAKAALQLSAYDDSAGITAQAVAFDGVNRATRATPVVPVANGGSAVVSYWADKSSATTTWTPSAGTSLRDLSVGGGGGRIVAALADSLGVGAGTSGGFAATANSSTAKALTWSIVLGPA